MVVQVQILPASSNDTVQIVAINNEFINSLDAEGFLVVPYSIKTLTQDMSDDEISFFVAKDAQSSIRGYIGFARSFDISLVEFMSWESEDSKELFMSVIKNQHLYIKQVAVTKNYQRMNIGKSLYFHLERLGYPIVVFVAEKPVLNQASLDFHIALGYKCVGHLFRNEFGRLRGYQSICFVKK